MDARTISIVVPVYEEADSLEGLLREIREAAGAHDLDAEVIFVDDGSRDASWSKIVALADSDPSVGGIRFRRNAGKAAALTAGFAAVRGDLVFTMDADLQDPPQEIPRFIAKIDEGFDVVSGWKRRRLDPWHKVYPSRVFNRMIGMLTGVRLHDHVCGFKCFRREVLQEVRIRGEFHRFMCVLAAARGFRVTEIPTLHRPRTTGVGKYGFSRFLKGFLDLLAVWFLIRDRWRPQHFIGVAGVVTVLLGLAAGVPLWLLPGVAARLTPAIVVIMSGLILVAIGLAAELMVADRPLDDLYVIAERVGWCARPPVSEVVPRRSRAQV